jgi:hypothetical protein
VGWGREREESKGANDAVGAQARGGSS